MIDKTIEEPKVDKDNLLGGMDDVDDVIDTSKKVEEQYDSKEYLTIELPSGFKISIGSNKYDVKMLADLTTEIFDYYNQKNGGKKSETTYTG